MIRLIASGFYSGYLPLSPGTWGTVAALLFWFTLSTVVPLETALYSFAAIAVLLIGAIYCSEQALTLPPPSPSEPSMKGSSDPQWIVIDEWAGMFVTLSFTSPHHLIEVLCGFCFFRLFDILKPGPVRVAERLPGGYGIVMDDVVAGLLALLLLQIGRSLIS